MLAADLTELPCALMLLFVHRYEVKFVVKLRFQLEGILLNCVFLFLNSYSIIYTIYKYVKVNISIYLYLYRLSMHIS